MAAASSGTCAQLVRLMVVMGVIASSFDVFAGWTPFPPWQRIEELANTRCNVCHGLGGVGANPFFPKLAGQNAGYLFRQMQNFRSGIRKGPVMSYQLSDLQTEQVAELAKHFAGLSRPPVVPGQNRLEAVGEKIFGQGISERGTEACAGCHGVDGRGGGDMPRLATQHAGYVADQLRRFQEGTRVGGQTPEHPVADALTEEEILAVSIYIQALP